MTLIPKPTLQPIETAPEGQRICLAKRAEKDGKWHFKVGYYYRHESWFWPATHWFELITPDFPEDGE